MGSKRKAPVSEKNAKREKSSEEEVESEEEEEISQSESGSESEGGEEEESSSDGDETSDEESRKEKLRSLLEPFGKDQIINLLKEAAAKDPKLIAKIIEVADADPTCRKIFVHGLSWDATAEQLIQAFKPFGEIEDSKLVMDKITGRAKGYAFVLFKTSSAAKNALKVPQKQIGNRTVSCQLAAAGPPGGTGAAAVEEGSRKMYVGNVGAHVDPEKLKDFFRRYGEIEDGPIGLDYVTNKFKGFAVITYKSPEGFKKAMEEPIKVFENCQLHCKKFVEKENRNNAAASQSSAAVATPPVPSYASLGMNPALFGANLNASGLLMPQNLGMGLAGNPMLAGGYNPASLMASGLSTPIPGMGTNYGMSSINPSVMGSYGSQAALQGLGAYQNSQPGQSSTGTPTATDRPAARGASPVKTSYTAYYRR